MKAAQSMFACGDAFVEFEDRFDRLTDITTESLLEIGGPDWLRRHGRVSYFLVHSKIATISGDERRRWAESRRIESMLDELDARHRRVAEGFVKYCRCESQISETTLRVYLRAGVTLMNSTKKSLPDIDEKAIVSFLKRHPGHRHSLYRFVTYLHSSGRAPHAKMPKKKKQYRPTYTENVVNTLNAYEREFTRTDSHARKRALAAVCVAKMLGLPVTSCLRMSRSDVDVSKTTLRLRIDGTWYECGGIAQEMIREICRLDLRESRLFPGRLPDDCLSASGAASHARIAQKSFMANT